MGNRSIDLLLKNVLDLLVEIGMRQMDQYENDFEKAMLTDTVAYYSRKALNWILEDSCPEYMLKAEECCDERRTGFPTTYISVVSQSCLRKCNMSCYPCMLRNYSRRNILVVMHYLGMTRWMICLGCTDSFPKYLKGQIQFLIFSSIMS